MLLCIYASAKPSWFILETLYPLQNTDHLTSSLALGAPCQICYPTVLVNANKKPEALNKPFQGKIVVEGGGTKQWKNLFDSCWVFLLLLFWGITVEPAVSESPELCCCFSGIVVQSRAPLKTHTKAKLQIQTSWLKSNTKEQKGLAKGYRPARQPTG